MSKLMQGSLAKIKQASRRPVWEDPNLQYDGAEPPKGWLDRLKRLRQIHGYNDKEIVHVAEKCMRGSAQLWFRIHHPKSFEALRTGLHTRFASGPILVPADVASRAASGRLRSASPTRSDAKKLVPSVVQWNTAANSSPPNGLELVANSGFSADYDAEKQCGLPNVGSKATRRSKEPLEDSDSSTALARNKSSIAASNISRDSQRGSSKHCPSGVGSTTMKIVGANCSSENGRVTRNSQVLQRKNRRESKRRMEMQAPALSADAREGDFDKDSGTKSADTTSVSLSTMSHRILARTVLEENGSRNLPVSCNALSVNWKEALLKFKHAIHLAIRVVCLGDVILFEEKLRAGFDVLNGNQFDNSIRTVVGRVVKDVQSTSSQQQVFTVEVYWSKGQQSFRPMRPLCIAARHLFSLHPLRQRWMNEDARRGLLDEKRNFTLEEKASDGLKKVPPA